MQEKEYEDLIKKSLHGLDLSAFRIEMLRHLKECEIPEMEIKTQYKIHSPDGFFPLRCHQKAFEYLSSLDACLSDKVRLVQGVTRRFEGRFPEEHSWIEIEGRIVFDGVLQNFYDKECYRKKKCLSTPLEFSFNEAIKLHELYGKAYFPDKPGFEKALQYIRASGGKKDV